jgi:hypothetical protein
MTRLQIRREAATELEQALRWFVARVVIVIRDRGTRHDAPLRRPLPPKGLPGRRDLREANPLP